MSDSKQPHLEESIDRYARGELSAPEARELAQKSLEDPKLFEDLTWLALTKGALGTQPVRERLQQSGSGADVVRFPRKDRMFVAVAAAAAALVLVSVYFLRSSYLQNQFPPSQRQSHETAKTAPLKPVLAFSAAPGQPLLLASGLQPEPVGREGAPVFRGREPDSRSPRPSGSIVSIEDGLATIDLGSLDGLEKGSELRLFRDDQSSRSIGRLLVTTVFRERSRGQIVAGQEIRINDHVRVASAVYLDALLQQVDALSGRGDPNAARMVAERAVAWAEAEHVSPGARRKALGQLAVLEYQAGSPQAAEKHYQSVVDSLARTPSSEREESLALNNLAVLHLLRGDHNAGEALLSQALAKSPAADLVYARSSNNLGVLAELRGNRRKAEAHYADALRALKSLPNHDEQERRAVETNLARVTK